jgi:hypothetical protein
LRADVGARILLLMTTRHNKAERMAAVAAAAFAVDTGDSLESAERDVCIEFGCTPEQLAAWTAEEVADLDAAS